METVARSHERSLAGPCHIPSGRRPRDLVLFGVVEAAQTDRVPVGRLEADPSVGSETDMGAFDWLVLASGY